jgi:hypothetical protein
MDTPTDDVTVDFDKVDAEVAKGRANGADPGISVEVEETPVVETSKEPAKVEKTALSTEEGLEKLQKQLADERAARVAAERRANEASQAEVRALSEKQTSQIDMVKGAIERVTQSSDALEAKYAELAVVGDWQGAAKVQRQMADNAAQLQQLERNKATLENAPKPTPRAPDDAVEKVAAQLTPQSAAWVRAHPEYVRDPILNKKMVQAHYAALGEGHAHDTPEYFKTIEQRLGLGVVEPARQTPRVAKQEVDEETPLTDSSKEVGGRSGAAPAAPVSRSGNGAAPRSGRITLTPAQVEAAANSGMTNEEYAKQVLALRREGKLN